MGINKHLIKEELIPLLESNRIKPNSIDYEKILSLAVQKKKVQKTKFKFIDLFSGIGGMRLPFEALGGECVFSSEIDNKAKLTYFCNFGDIPAGDICKTQSKDIPKHDILLAGFPCQAFSIAGYRKGLKDERGALFFEVLRVLNDKKPKSFLLENVKGLTNLKGGRVFRDMLSALEESGYTVYWKVLNTMEYGNIPQTRERVYMVGFKKSLRSQFSFPEKVQLTKSIKDVLLKNKAEEQFYYNRFSMYKILKKEMKKKDTIYQWRRTYVRENKSKVCPTLTANTGTGGHNVPLVLDNWGHRKLTPRECASFQGFSNNFVLPDFLSMSHLYKQIGNSVSVPVVNRVAKKMIDVLESEVSPEQNKKVGAIELAI